MIKEDQKDWPLFFLKTMKDYKLPLKVVELLIWKDHLLLNNQEENNQEKIIIISESNVLQTQLMMILLQSLLEI